MLRYYNCIAHTSSEGQLVIGDEKTAIFDCGMAFCAEKTICNVKNALKDESTGGRTLNYIFLTHTHYDHIGALPFFKKEWPAAKVVTSAAGAAVLQKDTPRRVIRELSNVAAKKNGLNIELDYNDDIFKADIIVKDGETVFLGGLSVEVLETPGHTRDSLCFFLPELELLILNETPGVLMPDGSMYPCYLTSYSDTMRSIEKCSQKPYKYLSLPHRGIAEKKDADGYFDKALKTNSDCRDFILNMKDNNYSEEKMLDFFYQKYGSEVLLTYQPKEAFIANARATIVCTLS